jgi:hypothetical protein
MKSARKMGISTRSCLTVAAALTLVPLIAGLQLQAQDCCDPASPFTPGEDYPKQPATCENIQYWAERAPDTVARISMAITGKLTAVNSDGALAYLVMCEAPGFEVMCITYSTNGMKAGDRVLFAGGYNKAGEKRAVLDPCLASRE